ncbi:MAG: phosphatidylinositol-specific phospholipase C1-like protein [Pseudomonadota bacterium]
MREDVAIGNKWLAGLSFLALSSCTEASNSLDYASCERPLGEVRLNELQSIGSHNSYKLAIPELEMDFIRLQAPDLAETLDYAHIPLAEQLDLGMRQLELDVFHDPVGGRFADPLLPKLASTNPGAEPFDAAGYDQPGLKVMHIQDIDQRSQCVLFIECLQEIDAWSGENPDHTPILILINAKQAPIGIPGATEALPFDAAAFDGMDGELLSVLSADRLITPDDLRGDAASLREGVLENGWPLIEQGKGKFLFALDEPEIVVETYMRGNASLEGLPLFVNSVDPSANHAAYFTINDPKTDQDRIREIVSSGFLVRTRADADTAEARANDTSRLEAALTSGAQYISTDYYLPREEFGLYKAALPNDEVSRCRP